MIERALGILVEPGSVVELRVPKAARRATVSGYYNDVRKLAESAADMSGKAEGVYVTLNPVRPDLIARAANRLIDYAKHTTANHDVLRLWSFLIDFDPVRPSGISSTDVEHEAALERARQCRDWLSAQGWAEPVFADSGNGAHLRYRIELPNDNQSSDLLRRCLEAVAFRFTNQSVEVDLATYNPARLVKVYGTLAAKGDSLPERPHRLARLLDAPGALLTVPLEKLEALARRIPKSEGRTVTREKRKRNNEFDLQFWIDLHRLDVDGPTSWNGGKRWIFRHCPWNPDHRDRSAYIVQCANGAIAAGCHHKSCDGKEWHSLRDLLEPGWRDPKPHNNSGKPTEEVILPPQDRVAEFPVDALPMPMARYVREVSESLSCPPDLVGVPALSALGAAIGTSRVLKLKPDWRERPVLFSAMVSDRGTLKSPALDKALKPTYDFQKQLQAKFEEAQATWEWREMEGEQAKRAASAQPQTLSRQIQ
jgi:hypothetical protein